MIGLDTNVLLRAVAIDDPIQTAQARAFIARNCTPGDPGIVSVLVLLEAAWVLENSYGYGREALVRFFTDLLAVEELVVERADAVRAALEVFGQHSVEFSDALIGEANLAMGCAATATFDRRAAKLPGFRRVA
jgi:predicted nucleic-acid-binding protein